jgi:hypothetical protein
MARINWHHRYDEYGFNIFGRDKDGFNRFDEDWEGYNRNGLDKAGYQRNGDGRNQINRGWVFTDNPGDIVGPDGFTLSGYNAWGFDRMGYDIDGRDADDYDREGYDREGYNRADLRRNGRTRLGHHVGNRYVYRFDADDNEFDDFHEDNENIDDENIDDENSDDENSDDQNSDDENSDDEQEGEILTLNNKSSKLVLDYNTNEGENYKLTPIPVCNADVKYPDGKAYEVHNLFNKEKKLFMHLYYSLGDKYFEPMTDNSLDLFIEIQRLFNAKLYSIVDTLPGYAIKISILIKALRKLLSKLYNLLITPTSQWGIENYCHQSRAFFLETICNHTKVPPKPLSLLKIWDLYLRYIRNLCSLNDKLFTDIIIDYALSNVEAYRNDGDHDTSLEHLNRLIDREGEDSCDKGWIERLILCTNDFIKKQQLLKGNASKLFKRTTMHNLVKLLIKDLKERDEKKKLSIDKKKELNLEEVNLFTYINEFKLSEENNRIVGDLETKKRILKNKLYCYIYERLSKIYNISDTFPLRENIDKYVESSIYEEDFNDKGKYEKKYLKYKNKYLNLKKINKLKVK